MKKDAAFFETARKRKDAAETFWAPIFEAYDEDMGFFTGTGQWTQEQLDAREQTKRPALTFNQVRQPVLRQTNQLRQNKPAIKITPMDADATAETAEFFEGKIRNIEYRSQADVARMHAAKCASIGGLGYYRVNTEYPEGIDDVTDPAFFEQDAVVRPILNPKSVLFDPKVQRFDFSDGKFCFVTEKKKWDEYKRRWPKASLISWDAKDARLTGWADQEEITIAEYWHLEPTGEIVDGVKLTDGRQGARSDFTAEDLGKDDENVAVSRKVHKEELHFDLINGVETLEETIWLGYCIPILPVLGDLVIDEDGELTLEGMVRAAKDGNRLLNGFVSGTAENIGLTNRVPYTGPKGMFRSDKNWQNAHLNNPAYLEWDPVYDDNGQLIAASPQRQEVEPAVQALSAASIQMVDFIKRAMGYSDDVLQPSKSDLSGVAIERRSMTQETSNFHISDSLALAMWHEGNIYLDLLPKLHDSPKALQVTSEAGDVSTHYVTAEDEQGNTPAVPGQEDKPHHVLNRGRYQCAVTIGPTYATKVDEESDLLTQLIPPELMPAFLPTVFKLRGYPDLEAVAEAMAPPQVQALKNGQPQVPPEVQQQVAQMTAELQATKAELMKLQFEKQAKTQELMARHTTDVENNMVKLMIADIQAKSKESIEMLTHRMSAIENLLKMFHESELAPGPDQGNQGLHPQAIPQPMPAGQEGAAAPEGGTMQ